MTTTARRCKGVNKQGEPCSAALLEGSEYCFFHDPAKRAERAEARRAGGRARHGRNISPIGEIEPIAFTSVEDVLRYLEDAANDLQGLERSVARARAQVQLATAAADLLRVSELETRIRQLEDERLRQSA